jgi:hypothetical protein
VRRLVTEGIKPCKKGCTLLLPGLLKACPLLRWGGKKVWSIVVPREEQEKRGWDGEAPFGGLCFPFYRLFQLPYVGRKTVGVNDHHQEKLPGSWETIAHGWGGGSD